jgi:high-affinity nickel permease
LRISNAKAAVLAFRSGSFAANSYRSDSRMNRDTCSRFWVWGFLLGMLHGLEADHIAAIGVNTIVATGFA